MFAKILSQLPVRMLMPHIASLWSIFQLLHARHSVLAAHVGTCWHQPLIAPWLPTSEDLLKALTTKLDSHDGYLGCAKATGQFRWPCLTTPVERMPSRNHGSLPSTFFG